MTWIFFFLFIIISSCSSNLTIKPKESRRDFSFYDVSGHFVFHRDSKFFDNKLISRQKISSIKTQKNLETSISVSKLGSVSTKVGRTFALMPLASDFEVWLDGKKYVSRLRTDTKNKKMILETEGLNKEDKWYGKSSIDFPRSKFFCFFSQIPECLYQIGFLQNLTNQPEQSRQFYVIWDSFPFVQDQYSGIGKSMFSYSSIKFDREEKGKYLFELELDGQLMLYYFSKEYDLAKIVWIAQGITILPPGEEPNQHD